MPAPSAATTGSTRKPWTSTIPRVSLQMQNAFSHRDAGAKDAHFIAAQAHLNTAWPFLGVALLNHHGRLGWDTAIFRQIAGQGPRGAPGGRVLNDPHGGIEEAGVGCGT